MTDVTEAVTYSLPPWWEEWGDRLQQELDAFTERGLPVTVVEDPRAGANRLVVESEVSAGGDGGQAVRVQVVYPDGYPHRRFMVYAPDLELARHQAPGGNLCVLPRDPRFWHPAMRAADSIADDVPRLIDLVERGGSDLREAEDPQAEPFTTYYGGTLMGGIVVDERALTLADEFRDGGVLALGLSRERTGWLKAVPNPQPAQWTPEVGQGFLINVHDRRGNPLLPEPREELAQRYPSKVSGRWIWMPEPPRVGTATELWAAAVEGDPELARWAERERGLQLIGIATLEEVQQDHYDVAWVFLTRFSEQVRPSRKQTRSRNPAAHQPGRRDSEAVTVRALRWTEHDLGVRIPELAPLRDSAVAVVGLGSLGAPLVQELVKARVGTLSVTDRDSVDAATSVRYPLGLDFAGIDKGLALKIWANQHDPAVQVRTMGMWIGDASNHGSGPSERQHLQEMLEDADLLIGATAEDDVNRQLDRAGSLMGVPRLFLWSQSGYGGIVALLHEATGCFHCLSLMLSDAGQAGEPVVEVPEDDPRGQRPGTIQGRGCADKTFTAAHPDLLPLSIHAARVAFDALTAASTGERRMKGDVYAVQVRETDGTPIPPRWTTLDLPPDARCSNCHASH